MLVFSHHLDLQACLKPFKRTIQVTTLRFATRRCMFGVMYVAVLDAVLGGGGVGGIGLAWVESSRRQWRHSTCQGALRHMCTSGAPTAHCGWDGVCKDGVFFGADVGPPLGPADTVYPRSLLHRYDPASLHHHAR